jgi:type I restriction enzyme S subunit
MSWQTESLGNLLAPAGSDRAGEEDLPVLSITMQDGLVDQSTKFKKRIASRDISTYRVVYTDELVVGFPIDEGVLGFQTKYRAAVVSPAYGIWKLRKPKQTHIPFVERYLRSGEARQIYARAMRGAVARRRSISREAFLAITIPFPPLDEQKRIASLLEKADTLRRQRHESIALLEALLQSVFATMLGDPSEHPQSKLVDLLKRPLRNGLSPASGGTHAGTVFTLSAITRGYFDSGARKSAVFASPPKASALVTDTDFLICRGNGNIKLCGQGQFPSEDAVGIVFPDTIIAASIDLTRVSKGYFATLWNQSYVRRQLERGARTAAGIYKVNQTTLENILIPVPNIEKQKEFERTALRITSKRPELESSARYSDSLFLSIQQRAFRGELDLSRVILDSAPIVARVFESDRAALQSLASVPLVPLLTAPDFLVEALRELDTLVANGDQIGWSGDYFKYRILASQSIPFSFNEVMQKADSVFDDPPYEEIKDIIMDLLGKGGNPALLTQTFDLNIDAATKETSGRKEIVFGRPA